MSKKSTCPKDWREGRRMRAWELHEQGWKQKDIAAALGVSEGAVSQWFKKAKAQGAEALRHQPAPGATPKLSPEQRAQLPALLGKGAEAFGFRGQVWTTERVAAMIRQSVRLPWKVRCVCRPKTIPTKALMWPASCSCSCARSQASCW